MKSEKERLLLELIHFLSEKFKERLVLEGGMLLRLLGNPRYTQDIDYFFISKKSKKELAAEVRKALESLDFVKIISISLNSRGIFCELEGLTPNSGRVMLEISVVSSLHTPTEQFSTAALSNQYSLGGRIISVISMPEAFANKIAACIERNNLRDLYDLSVFEPLSFFDVDTLLERLEKVSVERKRPRKMTAKEANEVLLKRANDLTEKRLHDELYPLIPEENRAGLVLIIKAAVMRIAQRIGNL